MRDPDEIINQFRTQGEYDSAPLTPNEVRCYRELFHLFDQSEEWGGDVLEEVSGIFSRYGIKLTDHTECTDKDEES